MNLERAALARQPQLISINTRKKMHGTGYVQSTVYNVGIRIPQEKGIR
jgi:hypothetical protein